MYHQTVLTRQASRPNPSIPRTLASLPQEVLYHICLLLDDNKDAISLALTSRVFTRIAEKSIWSHIRLSASDGDCRSADDAILFEQSLPGRRVLDVLRHGNQQRFSQVESLELSPRMGIVQGMMVLLDLVSPNLKQLALESSYWLPDYVEVSGPEPVRAYYDTFQYSILTAGLHFPYLTHLRIYFGGMRYLEILPLLFNSAPSLRHVDLDIDDPDILPEEISQSFPTYQRQTPI